jgi:transposase
VEVKTILSNRQSSSVLSRLAESVPEASAGEPPSTGTTPVRRRGSTARRLNERAIDDIVAAYEGGATVRQLAERFEVSRATVSSRLESRGIARRRTGRSLDDDEVRDACERYEAGESLAQLGTAYGVDPSTVWNTLKRQGVSRRPPSGSRT